MTKIARLDDADIIVERLSDGVGIFPRNGNDNCRDGGTYIKLSLDAYDEIVKQWAGLRYSPSLGWGDGRPATPPRFFSGDDSRTMWRGINKAETVDELQTAVYSLALQVQRLEESLYEETAVYTVACGSVSEEGDKRLFGDGAGSGDKAADGDNPALLPCPFCGYAVTIMRWNPRGQPVEYDVECDTDGCILENSADNFFPSAKATAKAWNTRSSGCKRPCATLNKLKQCACEQCAWAREKYSVTKFVNLKFADGLTLEEMLVQAEKISAQLVKGLNLPLT